MTDESPEAGGPERPDRASVRRFFSLRPVKAHQRKDLNVGLLLGVGALGLLFGAALAGPVGGLVVGALAAGAVILIHNAQADSSLQSWNDQVNQTHAELVRLAHITRDIQAADITKAMLRIFERLQLDATKLRILDQVYVFEEEEKLFDEETRERKLGDLVNKSIRLISWGEFQNVAYRGVVMDDSGSEEYFFNPTRLIMILLTETQLVVCEVQIDSMDGSLLEETQRVALKKIVNVHFTAKRIRHSATFEQLLRLAEDLKYNEATIGQIKRTQGGDPSNSEWALEELKSTVVISRTDGGSLDLPIRSDVYFGKQQSALDTDGRLNQHEIKVDRMVNELNRLVETG